MDFPLSGVLLKIKQECVPLLILIKPFWSTQLWYPELLNLCVKKQVLLPQGKEILISPESIVHPDTSGLVGSGKPFHVKKFQKTLHTLSQTPDEKANSLILSQP